MKINISKPCVLDSQVDLEHASNNRQCVHSHHPGWLFGNFEGQQQKQLRYSK